MTGAARVSTVAATGGAGVSYPDGPPWSPDEAYPE